MTLSRLNKNFFLNLGLSALLLFLFASCIATKQDIRNLDNKIAALNKRVHSLEYMEKSLTSIRDNQAEIGVETDTIRSEIQKLTGLVEEASHLSNRTIEKETTEQDIIKARLTELETDLKRLHEYLGLELTALNKIQKAETASQTGPQQHTRWQVPILSNKSVSPESMLYGSALTNYREGKYEDAITGLKNFLKKYPKSDLADNAQFWIGECYMSLNQYEQAILAYQKVIKRYPKGNKISNAMLRQALAFHEIKDKVSSKLLLKKIIKNYPNSIEAAIAKKRLKKFR